MKFTVLWTPRAGEDLARVWMNAHDRMAITSAAYMVDRLLARNPDSAGKLRFDTVRSLCIEPLGVDYEVIELDRIVYVLTAWDARQQIS